MTEIFQNIFALSIQIGILIGIVLLLGCFTKKKYMAAGRYFLWLVLAVRLLIPINMGWVNMEELKQGMENCFSLEMEEQTVEEMADKNLSNPKNVVQETNMKQKRIESQPVKQELEEDKKLEQKQVSEGVEIAEKEDKNIGWVVLSMIWILGLLVMTGYEVIMYQSVYKSIKRWKMPAPREYREIFAQVCKEMHIAKDIPVYRCAKVASPMIVGIFRPSVILPDREYEKESLYYIYRHELPHFCHKDLYYKLIQTMVRCIYWFHPLVHAMYRQAAFDVELVCDETVIKNQSETFCQEYSLVLLDTLTVQNQRTFPLSTCFFNGGKKQMKERFVRIMSQNKKKYGIGLFGLLIVCALILGNVSLQPKAKQDVSKTEKNYSVTEKLTETKNILVVGQENMGNQQIKSADMVLLVTLNPEQKKYYITDIGRDIAITCEGKYTKISGAYAEYGMDSFKKALEKEIGMEIDSTVEVDFQQFEDVIDSVGGLSITLTGKEADYLNSTNYIREEKYRNVTEGTQTLNGQQVLGYARIRRVKSASGQDGTFGRGERAIHIVSALCEKVKETGSKNWEDVVSKLYNIVSTGKLDLKTVYQMMDAVFLEEYTCETMQIPENGSYEGKCDEKIGAYLDYDFSTSDTIQKIKGEKVTVQGEDGEIVIFKAKVLK